MKDIETKTAQYLLNHYPRPQDIVWLGYERLVETLKKISRGRMGRSVQGHCMKQR